MRLPRPRLRLPLQVYLLSLIVFVAVVVGAATVYQNSLRLDRARDMALASMNLATALAADDIGDAIDGTQEAVNAVAANPGLSELFTTTPVPPGCSLSFAGAGPFARGHLDVINRDGKVLCSSRPIPKGGPYAGETWLRASEPGVVGPVDDGGTRSVVVLAPVADLGVVATFLDVEPVANDLEQRYTSTPPADFELRTEDADERATDSAAGMLERQARISGLGGSLHASVREDAVLEYAHGINRQVTAFLVAALLLVVALTQLIYLGIARPIRRLSTSVGAATSGKTVIDPPRSGPTEVVSLGENFATLTRHVASELAQRERAETEARTSEESYRTMFEANPQPTWAHDADTGRLIAVNEAMVRRFGWSREELLTMRCEDLIDADAHALRDALAGTDLVERSGPWELHDRAGDPVECLVTSDMLELRGVSGRIVVAEDVTVQLRNERLLQRTERMESLGQLAGGIAHDFNNVLAVMLNYASFAAEELSAAAAEDPERWEPVLHDVEQVGAAGDRAAALTRSLLSFARGDVLQVGAVDLHEVASGIEPLLRGTLGEQVDLHLATTPGLWPVEANRGQLEQVIVNLAVNARDAMPDGGQLSIETMNVEVDAEHSSTRPERQPGRYVRLRVSDNGVGMDEKSRDRAFEPFFTTKDRANGTGLGLATVYGVVSRAGGTIDIYSEPGLGTTISMYLPATQGHADQAQESTVVRPRSGSETVLLVEDDDALRSMAERILAGDGYRVLTAEDGPAGEVLAEGRRGEIDLLLTDVVMPGMLGSELARRVTSVDPAVRVLFMSGYAPPLQVNGGVLPGNAAMLDKPFSADLLLQRVREVLDMGN